MNFNSILKDVTLSHLALFYHFRKFAPLDDMCKSGRVAIAVCIDDSTITALTVSRILPYM